MSSAYIAIQSHFDNEKSSLNVMQQKKISFSPATNWLHPVGKYCDKKIAVCYVRCASKCLQNRVNFKTRISRKHEVFLQFCSGFCKPFSYVDGTAKFSKLSFIGHCLKYSSIKVYTMLVHSINLQASVFNFE